MNDLPETAVHYLDSARGVYIPQNFAEIVKRDCVANVTDEEWAILEAGPDHEWYWDTWNAVEGKAVLTDPTTHEQFTLYQDGDLWLIPAGYDWPDEYDFASSEDIFIP